MAIQTKLATIERHGIDPLNILTPEELAGRLKVPKSWVFEKTRARCQNPIPHYRIGRYVRFDWTRVVEWLARTEEGTDAARSNLS
jgi:excisionase family DNA binding protein